MNNQPETQIEQVYSPSSRQTDRRARIRRFNLLAVYLPIGLASLLALALTILLLIAALGDGSSKALETISAVADSVMILAIIPTMVLCQECRPIVPKWPVHHAFPSSQGLNIYQTVDGIPWASMLEREFHWSHE